MADSEMVSVAYAIVSNIPKVFRSCDLRNFFSQFTEKGKFKCFHYRHRPEKLLKLFRHQESSDHDGLGQNNTKTCFCIVKLADISTLEEFIKLYNDKHWVNNIGDPFPSKCLISTYISAMDNATNENIPFFKNYPELHPPAVMPNGNVGTPTAVFLELIRSCRLPPAIIKKLQLEFPITKGRRKYSSVPYDYGGVIASSFVPEEERVLTRTGHELSANYVLPIQRKKELSYTVDEVETDEDSSDCEDWERHESLHDDVTQQERTKERLYEEEIELQWEKGGSGLVFYTDAQYWDEQEGDFDAKTSDDWDIDMSGYYEKDGGDKDARDYLQMRKEQALRNGTTETFPLYPHKKIKVFKKRQIITNSEPRINIVKTRKRKNAKSLSVGKFEKHTKGFGRKIMEKYGWKEGEGLGHSVTGITEALENEGQNPNNKSGFGYYGEKLNRFFKITTKRNPEFS